MPNEFTEVGGWRAHMQLACDGLGANMLRILAEAIEEELRSRTKISGKIQKGKGDSRVVIHPVADKLTEEQKKDLKLAHDKIRMKLSDKQSVLAMLQSKGIRGQG